MATYDFVKTARTNELYDDLVAALGAHFTTVIGRSDDPANPNIATSGTVVYDGVPTGLQIQAVIDAYALEGDHNVTFTANRNNLPLRNYSYYSVTATTPINITGIVASTHGRIVMATNIGANTITLVNASASSLAANRIINPAGTNYSLTQNKTVMLVYNTDVNRWGIVL